jgi:hypothetical protein
VFPILRRQDDGTVRRVDIELFTDVVGNAPRRRRAGTALLIVGDIIGLSTSAEGYAASDENAH